jgi:Holliday junction resolvase-like predicted endonuclease
MNMSSVSKGKRFENFVADQLKQAGYHIAYKSVRMRFGAIDFDGLWDIVAVKRGTAQGTTWHRDMVTWLFVQCKSKRMYGVEKQQLIDWMHTYGFEGISCMIAVKVKQGRKTAIEWHNLS